HPEGYDDFLHDLKERIRVAQVRAALAVNRELVLLYWEIGRDILARQQQHGWGARVVDRLASDLHHAFPEVRGFSPRNLKYMRAFAEAWSDEPIVQAVLAQITWYHNITLLEKLKAPEERLWYVRQTIQHGWSRNVIVYQIESGLYHLRLRCFVVIDLKMSDFQPEFAGKMNFYLSAVDDLLRHPSDQPSIGIILCKTRNRVIVEYALRDTSKPIGIAEYHLTALLPEALKGSLPTIEDLEAELGGGAGETEDATG